MTMWRVIFTLVLLPGITLAEPADDNPKANKNTNTVEKFTLEESDFYRGDYGKEYAFLNDDWYGWWKRKKTAQSHLYFRRRGFGHVYFPVPEEDAILPVFGRLYRVSGNPKDLNLRTFTLVKTDTLPEGLDVEKESMIVPLERDEVGRLFLYRLGGEGSLTITITKIDSDNGKRTAHGKAIIAPIHPSGVKRTPATIANTRERTEALELKEGDVLNIDQRTLTVRRIVPMDYKGSKTVGWVELGVEERKR
jgi:hypothetical protein